MSAHPLFAQLGSRESSDLPFFVHIDGIQYGIFWDIIVYYHYGILWCIIAYYSDKVSDAKAHRV